MSNQRDFHFIIIFLQDLLILEWRRRLLLWLDLFNFRLAQEFVQNSSLLEFHEADLHKLAMELHRLGIFDVLAVIHLCAIVRESHMVRAQLVPRVYLQDQNSLEWEKFGFELVDNLPYNAA